MPAFILKNCPTCRNPTDKLYQTVHKRFCCIDCLGCYVCTDLEARLDFTWELGEVTFDRHSAKIEFVESFTKFPIPPFGFSAVKEWKQIAILGYILTSLIFVTVITALICDQFYPKFVTLAAVPAGLGFICMAVMGRFITKVSKKAADYKRYLHSLEV